MNKTMFSSQILQQVKDRCDLPSVVGQYTKLNRNLKAICPFHTEKTPSFSIHSSKKFWRCFGCGESGDVIRFVQLINKLSFSDTVNILASKVGVPLPRSERFKLYVSRRWEEKRKLLERWQSVNWNLKKVFSWPDIEPLHSPV